MVVSSSWIECPSVSVLDKLKFCFDRLLQWHSTRPSNFESQIWELKRQIATVQYF